VCGTLVRTHTNYLNDDGSNSSGRNSLCTHLWFLSFHEYSRHVTPHLAHLKNWVEASSPPRVCTIQWKASPCPHSWQRIFTVGSVRIFSSSSPITTTDSLAFPSFCTIGFERLVSCPHFGHASTTVSPLFVGVSVRPHFGQNCILHDDRTGPCGQRRT
jgi:hypothetical protein